ncbi:hypothetical protein ACWF0M_36730 [Kribbella sp. NPDC055110]
MDPRFDLPLYTRAEAALALRSRAGRHYPLAWSGLAHDGRDLLVEIRPHIRPPAFHKTRPTESQAEFLL